MSSCQTKDLLYMLIHLNKQLACRFEADVGLSPNRLELLCRLSREEEISQSELQKAVSIDPAAVTRHVQQMEAEGILVRTRSNEDNRITLVRLTEQGKDWIDNRSREKDQFMEKLQEQLSAEDRQELIRLLSSLARSMESVGSGRKTDEPIQK